MPRPGIALLRAAALTLMFGLGACGAEQQDLGTISGVPDAPFGGGRGNWNWGSMSTGGQAVTVHRELPQQ